MGAENLCHQAIFMNHASGAVTALDPEMVLRGFPVDPVLGEVDRFW
jgi:hypothetical protein